MLKINFLVFIILLMLLATGCALRESIQPQEVQALEGNEPQMNCPLTTSTDSSFKAPAPYPPDAPFQADFWFGTEHLWTALPKDGIWSDLPHNPEGYTQKIFWWSSLFSLKDELEPALVVFGERLDADAPPLNVSKATNAFADDIGSAMLVGVDFPTEGCWKITGQYKKTGLTFVVQVIP